MIEDKTLEFSAKQNSIDLLYDDERFSIVSIDLMHEDETEDDCNNNMCNISHEAIIASLPTIFNTTISCRYNNNVLPSMVDSVVEHYSNDKELFETHIVGHIPTDARVKFIKRDNGKTYLNVEAILHKKLEPQIIDILNKNNGELKVSTVLRCKGEQNKDTGIFKVDSWILMTTTLLGKDGFGRPVVEGIEGSHLEVKKFSRQQLNKANEIYMQFAYNGAKKQDIFEEIKNKQKKENVIVNSIGTKELEQRLWQKLKEYKYSDGSWQGEKYWIQNILPDSNEVIVYDNQDAELYKIPYKISEDGDIGIDENGKIKVIEEINYREVANSIEWVFAKEDYGTGAPIEIDKSKEAMSNTEWGKVNKISQRNKGLSAKNYKEVIKAMYLIVGDGWEDAPSKELKYPVMQIIGGKAVYNRYGLASALTYAKANNEDGVVAKIMELYKKLDIGEDKKEDKTKDNAATTENKIVNAIPIVEQKPKDVEDGDKEDWKKKHDEVKNAYDELNNKYSELMNKCGTMESKLAEYKLKEDKVEMFAYLKSFKKSFSKDEYEIIAKEIDKKTKADFEKLVDEKVKEFVRKMSESEIEEDGDDNEFESKNCFGLMRNYVAKANDSNVTSIDEVLERLK